jgi:hypothetical protein
MIHFLEFSLTENVELENLDFFKFLNFFPNFFKGF